MKIRLPPVKSGRGPAHAQIETSLASAIGRFPAGTRLPAERGLAAGARVVSAREQTAGPEALGGGPVYKIVRVRLADGSPVALERTWFPVDAFPGLLEGPLEGSLYDLIRGRYDDMPTRVTERLEPALAGDDDAAALEVQPGAPLMRVERIGHAASGRPVELSH